MHLFDFAIWRMLTPMLLIIFFFTPLPSNSEELANKAEQAFYAGDLVAAKNYYSELAQTNNPESHYYLGLIYKMSDPDQKNSVAMLSHFEKAASLGNALAMWELGVIYESGNGVGQNHYIAMDWFWKSEQHSTLPDETVFFITEPDGALTEYQPADYFEYLLMRAQAGDTDAQFSVAALYDRGQLTSVDRNAALNWYLAAAQSGHKRAAYVVSYFYCRGIVAEKEPAKANYWASKSNLNTKCEH